MQMRNVHIKSVIMQMRIAHTKFVIMQMIFPTEFILKTALAVPTNSHPNRYGQVTVRQSMLGVCEYDNQMNTFFT